MSGNITIMHLGDMLGDDCAGENPCMDIFNGFSCPKNKDIENFLKDTAIFNQKLHISRTYLAFITSGEHEVLAGYFTISAKTLVIDEDVDSSFKKIITGFKHNDVSKVPVFLIGQLSKNFCEIAADSGFLIEGKELLEFALKKIIDTKYLIGGRAVLVECCDDDNLKKFYESNGFSFMRMDETDNLLQYIMKTDNARFA